MYRKYRIVESIASCVSQYESYRDQVYRYTPSKNWVGLGKLSNLVARRSMVISCVLLYDSITGL